MTGASELSAALGARIDQLVVDLLPNGHREGADWRCGSVAGEAGASLAVKLAGDRRGVWHDFATGEGGDALDLVRAALGCDMREALAWARRWLGIDDGEAATPRRPESAPAAEASADPDRWRHPWRQAVPIGGTIAERYLFGRGLRYADPAGAVLRFANQRARLGREGRLEYHPALLALLRDIRTGKGCGLVNVYLRHDGADRRRDEKAKTNTGRVRDAAVMLSPHDDVTLGVAVCEGVETGTAILNAGFAPVWTLAGAGNVSAFPLLSGIEALTIAADADPPGQRAAEACAARWRAAGRAVRIVAPPAGDWAAPRRLA